MKEPLALIFNQFLFVQDRRKMVKSYASHPLKPSANRKDIKLFFWRLAPMLLIPFEPPFTTLRLIQRPLYSHALLSVQ
jgi:hypothetical protein